MPVRRVAGNPMIAATRGQVALERGPVVYAFEGLDNDGSVFDIGLPSSAKRRRSSNPDLLGGCHRAQHQRTPCASARNKDGGLDEKPRRAKAIPYASWNNRGLSPMQVWLGRDEENTRPPAPRSHPPPRGPRSVFPSPAGAWILRPPQRSVDAAQRHRRLRPELRLLAAQGRHEWISYHFEKPIRAESVTVSWFDDTGTGECRLPESWKLLYQDESGAWKPVEGASEYAIRKADPVSVTFKPVTTRALRLEIEQADGFSAGLYEWEVGTN
jgi:uncharacterized protein